MCKLCKFVKIFALQIAISSISISIMNSHCKPSDLFSFIYVIDSFSCFDIDIDIDSKFSDVNISDLNIFITFTELRSFLA